MNTRSAPITQTSIESVDAVALDDVTGGCRRCGCGTQVASYQNSAGFDPSRLALAFAFSTLVSKK